MSDFTDFTTMLKEWANREDWSDALVASFIRGAEEKLNAELRIDRMIQTDDALIASRCAPLPDDWLEMDLVRLVYTSDFYPSGFAPIDYKPRAEFFSTPDSAAFGFYTIEGRQIFLGGTPNSTDGQTVRIDYYGEVPVFSDTSTLLGLQQISVIVPICLVDARGPARARRGANGLDAEAVVRG